MRIGDGAATGSILDGDWGGGGGACGVACDCDGVVRAGVRVLRVARSVVGERGSWLGVVIDD